MRRAALVLSFVVSALLLLVTVPLVVAVIGSWKASGAAPQGERLRRLESSPRWQKDHFVDVLLRRETATLTVVAEWLIGGNPHREPDRPVPVVKRSAGEFFERREGLHVTWLGHSTLLVEIEGHRVLIDPVWSERASPLSWVGPLRFFAPPLSLRDLPPLDAVLVSHDHYDHLDMPTVMALSEGSEAPFVVPLGVGAHLEYWGVPPDRIVELDWWQEHERSGLRLVATPARHFSGRSLVLADRDRTLWAGFAIIGSRHRVYYSGDTAMFPGMSRIGERLGPFDVTLIESGAYNQLWSDVHLGPEQAVQAHRLVNGKLMIPVHWGLFDLALHGWTEPVERVVVAAQAAGVAVATPPPGGTIDVLAPASTQQKRWWPDLTWKTAAQDPVVSSGLGAGP